MVGAGEMGGENGRPAHPPSPIDARMEKTMTIPGRGHPGPAPGEDAEDHRHEHEAGGQKDELAVHRGFQESLVDDDRADGPQVYAGKSFFCLLSDRSREFGNFRHGLQQTLFGHFDRDIYDTDITGESQNAPRDTRVGQSDVSD